MHGGELWVESASTGGSVFKVLLPVQVSPDPQQNFLQNPASQFQGPL
jgi:hypothetical protein